MVKNLKKKPLEGLFAVVLSVYKYFISSNERQALGIGSYADLVL